MEQIGTAELSERTGIPQWRIRYLARFLSRPPLKVAGRLVWGKKDITALVRLHESVPEVPQRGSRR